MPLVAIIPAASLPAANAALERQGFGPGNFRIFGRIGGAPSHAALHAWPDAAFEAAVLALSGVIHEVGEGDPSIRTRALIEAQGAQWDDGAGGAREPGLFGWSEVSHAGD